MSSTNNNLKSRPAKPVNRLILLGNGFDLAHGLPTRYSDFIFNFLKSNLLESQEIEKQNPLLLVIPSILNRFDKIQETTHIDQLLNLIHYCPKKVPNNFFYYNINEENNLRNDSHVTMSNEYPTLLFRHIFLDKSLTGLKSLTWTGFETQYYNTILDIISFAKKNGNSLEQEFELIKYLNLYFTELKNEFINYIKRFKDFIQNNQLFNFSNTDAIVKFIHLIDHSMNDIYYTNRPRNEEEYSFSPESTLVLDFNYTDTFNYYKYDNRFRSYNLLHIKIHGDVNSDTNPIVFGYGDEMHEDYKIIENRNNNEYLRYFKSFAYSHNSNYMKMTSFIESAPFEVFVLGHSCGLSDRVMLNSIFEHEYCHSIRIFYHKISESADDYLDIAQNISRHFSLDKRAIMRSKIVSKDNCFPMPQLKVK